MILSYFLILLANLNDNHKVQFDFFFRKLNTEKERLEFLKNTTTPKVAENIKTLITLFVIFDYNDPYIHKFAADNKLSSKTVIKWQKSFYCSVLKEYWDGNETTYFKQLKNNASFQYLLSLEDENNFNELFLLAINK